jgi:hypothetical protein
MNSPKEKNEMQRIDMVLIYFTRTFMRKKLEYRATSGAVIYPSQNQP